MIILTSATGFDINLTLWFISPLIYIFIPFLFYSTFQKTSNNKANSKLNLIILTLFVILLPQFLKEGRNANTGLIGTIIFFILIKEFYDLINDREFKMKDFFLIFLLYYFLCLTRFEECIYFLVLIVLYTFYYLFLKIHGTSLKETFLNSSVASYKKELKNFSQIINRNPELKDLKKFLIIMELLLFILLLIYVLSQEFFGYIHYFLIRSIGMFSFMYFIIDLYIGMRLIFLIIIMISGLLLLFLISYLLIFKVYNVIFKIYNYGKKIFYNYGKSFISSKMFQISFFPLLFTILIISNFLILRAYNEYYLLTIIALILGYLYIVFQLFLFFKGVHYYEIESKEQSYFIISIIAASTVIDFFLIISIIYPLNLWKFFYIFHTKFLTYFIFFNLINIQNTYLKEFFRMKIKYLILLTIAFFILGIFTSLRALRFG